MKAFFALVAREISERRALLAAAAVASLLPLLAPLLPSTGSNPPEDIREAVMWVVLVGLAPLFALLIGVSFVGRDLSEGRMGFYYAQPISGATIWFGKLTAVLVLVWAVECIIVLPTALLAPDPLYFLFLPSILSESIPTWMAPWVVLLVSAFVVLLAHAIGTIWRARSPWLVVDVVAFLVAVLIGWMAIRSFVPIVAEKIAIGSAYWICGWTMLGLVVAGLAQLAAGRVDLRRSHRFLSATFWSIVLVSFSILLGWTLWVRSAQLDDLDGVYDVVLGSGEWVAVSGTSPGRFDYYPRFLMNIVDGRSVDIGPATNWFGPGLEFSGDGSRAVWPVYESFDQWVLMQADLGSDDPTPAPTGVTVGFRWDDLAVSHSGYRFAVLDTRTLAAYGIENGEQLTAVQFPEGINPLAVSFDDADSIRVLATTRDGGFEDTTRWWLYWLGLDEKSLSTGIEIDKPFRWRQRSRDGEADHPLVWTTNEDGEHIMAIRDMQTGEILRHLGRRSYWSDVRVRDDGSIVVIRNREDESRVDVFETDGSTRIEIDLPDAEQIYHGGAIDADRVLFGLWTWTGYPPDRQEERTTVLVDLNSGTCKVLFDDVAPVLGRWRWRGGSAGAWSPGSTAGTLMCGDEGSLHLWDPETNELKQLIPVPN
ncbi:MAG: hypothetical protein AB1Z65_18320 [Candidatus Sulfomarinibacteraceae bacterium]